MKYNFLKISFGLFLVLNYSSLIQAQDQSSLIPPSIATPTTYNGSILVIQKGKPNLTYQSLTEGNDIRLNTQTPTTDNKPGVFYDPTTLNNNNNSNNNGNSNYDNNYGVTIGTPVAVTPSTPKTYADSDIEEEAPTMIDNNYGVTIGTPVAANPSTPKTYADSDIEEETVLTEDTSSPATSTPQVSATPSVNYPSSSTNNNIDPDLIPIPGPSPFDRTSKEVQYDDGIIWLEDEEEEPQTINDYNYQSFSIYSDKRINFEEQRLQEYINNKNKNKGLLSESLLSKNESGVKGVILNIRPIDDTAEDKSSLSENQNSDSMFSSDIKSNKGFFGPYDIPHQKHNEKYGE